MKSIYDIDLETTVQDGIEFKSRDGIAWFKPITGRQKQFVYYKCHRCGRLVSNCGWAYHQHKKKCHD